MSKEAAESVKTLLISTATYVSSRVENKKNRLAYLRAMSRCRHLCSETESGVDLAVMKHKLFELRYNVGSTVKKRWFNREEEYYLMAIQQAIDVVNSIYVRFVSGYSGKNELLFLTPMEMNIDEHQVCACVDRTLVDKR
jgi:hypothetical protein